MTRALYVITLILLLIVPYQGLASTRRQTPYGMPRIQHRRQTVKPYRLETKRMWSPCKHRTRRSKTGYDFPNVADTQCYVTGGGH